MMWNIMSVYVKRMRLPRSAPAAAPAEPAETDSVVAKLGAIKIVNDALLQVAQMNADLKTHKLNTVAVQHATNMLHNFADALKATVMAMESAVDHPDPNLDFVVLQQCCAWVSESSTKAGQAMKVVEDDVKLMG